MNISIPLTSDNSKFNFVQTDSFINLHEHKLSLAVKGDINLYTNYLIFGYYDSMNTLITSIANKHRIFYVNDNDYLSFEKYRKSIITIRNFLFKKSLSKDKKVVNEYSLDLTPINNNDQFVEIVDNDNIYRFIISDLTNIYKYSLKIISKELYFTQKLEPPKNPYTNKPFTFKQNLIIYSKIQEFYNNKFKPIPNYIENFKETYFSSRKFFIKNYISIMNTSIFNYLNDLSYKEFYIEFLDMIESDPVLTISYCTKCYSRINLKDIFFHTLKLYLLNSNGIYLLGDYKIHFKLVASKHHIFFKKDHILKHKKRPRLRRNYTQFPLRTVNRRDIFNEHPEHQNNVAVNTVSLNEDELSNKVVQIVLSEVIETIEKKNYEEEDIVNSQETISQEKENEKISIQTASIIEAAKNLRSFLDV